MDQDHMERYLQNAPLQTMRTEVSQYKAYLESINTSATISNLRLFVRITWLEGSEGNDNEIRVSLQGQEVITLSDVESRLNQSTDIGTSQAFSATPADRITVEITVVEEDLLGDDDNGKGTVTKRVSEFAKGYVLNLKAEEQTMAKAFILIKGYPKAPNLPAWHGKK